ncbi:MAG: uroporphyrinogen decarboxylase family protein [Candidatus Firestonebacteria bacterium]
MTGRERLLKVIRKEIPDCVPVAPDFSNMIPAKLTGLPFWDLYLYQKIPIWEAYIDCAKYFDIDSVMDGYFPLLFPEENTDLRPWQRYIVFKNEERIVVQRAYKDNGKLEWESYVDVFYSDNPPSHGVDPKKIGMPEVPLKFELLEGVKEVDKSPKGFEKVKKKLGEQGLIGVWAGVTTNVLATEEGIYHYYDHPEEREMLRDSLIGKGEERMKKILAMDVKPDFICVGGSGTLIHQTLDIFREIAFPSVKRVIEIATANGLPTHVHSCGPEKELVKIMAEETGLTMIDPLEIPPMGNCDLKELKRLYGNKIILKGNIHTTDIMLKGSTDDVRKACEKAIDDAREGGMFILSTGDQCGRDTPFENLRIMVETARKYGKY